MSEIKIIYWSGTGNTEEMAKAVAAGIEKAGGAAEVTEISDASAKSLEMIQCLRWAVPQWALKFWKRK